MDRPDPLWVARKSHDEHVALCCAWYGYGSAAQIIAFLDRIPFALLDENESTIAKELPPLKYRFQNPNDVLQSLITLRRLKQEGSLEEHYRSADEPLEGIRCLIDKAYAINSYRSRGYCFLLGSELGRGRIKTKGVSPLKRWNMFLRWMVRNDHLDMGLWKQCEAKNLIIPLDVHVFRTSQKLGLLARKSYDLESAILLTDKLREIDPHDPVKYDFALYRLGQERLV